MVGAAVFLVSGPITARMQPLRSMDRLGQSVRQGQPFGSTVAMLALPINTVAGLFGMTVSGVPLSEDPNGVWLVASGILSSTGLAALWFFARRD